MLLLLGMPFLAGCGPDVSVTQRTFDNDGDGYTSEVDCDDSHAAVNPDATEICDDLDNDCDGDVDDDPSDGATFHPDSDGDGAGNATTSTVACVATDGLVVDASDCDDAEARSFPGNPEVCDGLDNDCNGAVDDAPDDVLTFYSDGDDDGYGDVSLSVEGCDAPAGYVLDETDCDDGDAAVHPDADESDCADPTDYNCDGSVQYADADGDGSPACEDCDDSDAARSPMLAEVCDASDIDEDCDGVSDDEDDSVTDLAVWSRDRDADGYGDPDTAASIACEQPVGYADNGGDCDDYDSGANPGATEDCDAFDTDEDCDGLADDDDPSTAAASWTDWYRDADSDGHGDPSRLVSQCEEPGGYVSSADDCDDADATRNPGETEVCDSADKDEDCDGLSDDDDTSADGKGTWFADGDSDGYGDGAATVEACSEPAGFAENSEDCDDADATRNPGEIEVCDGADKDEDCDGASDDADVSATGQSAWYADSDADGYGLSSSSTLSCDSPSGYATTAGDCDDGSAAINPAAAEICDASNADEDCDGLADDADSAASGKSTRYVDADGDGYGGAVTATLCDDSSGYTTAFDDCDDSDATVNPAATEVCGNGTDDDCDGEAAECALTSASLSEADVEIWGEASDDICARVGGAGDVNGDGFDDVLLGAWKNDDGGVDAGAAYLVLGSATPWSGSASGADAEFTGEVAGDYAGHNVSIVGDVNSDGFDDILVGAPYNDDGGTYAGAAYLLLGASAWTSSSLAAADAEYRGIDGTDFAGYDVAPAGDFNDDGYDDFVIGAAQRQTGGASSGSAYLVLGGATVSSTTLSAAAAEFWGEGVSDVAGEAVAGGGDVDGDGFDDILVGAGQNDSGGADAGAAYLILGAASAASMSLGSVDAQYTGANAGDRVGDDVSLSGDADADGYDDILVGAHNVDASGTDSGAVYLVLGGPFPATMSLAAADATYLGEAASDFAGASTAWGGDTNGDGRDDFIVGAYGNDDAGGLAGAAYLVLGGASFGTLSLGDADAEFTGEAAIDYAGVQVAGVGDVDGDGNDDLGVGAGYNDDGGSGAGAVYLLLGVGP